MDAVRLMGKRCAAGMCSPPKRCGSSGGRRGDPAPGVETGSEEVAVRWCGEQVAVGAEVLADGAEGHEEPLRLLG